MTPGSSEHTQCCADKDTLTQFETLTSGPMVFESSKPFCAAPPCVRVEGLQSGTRQGTYHPSRALKAYLTPLDEGQSGITSYTLTVTRDAGGAVEFTTTWDPGHPAQCNVLGNCPTQRATVALGALPEGVRLRLSVTAVNGAGMTATVDADPFTLDATPPLAAPPQALLYQSTTDRVVLTGALQVLLCPEAPTPGCPVAFTPLWQVYSRTADKRRRTPGMH